MNHTEEYDNQDAKLDALRELDGTNQSSPATDTIKEEKPNLLDGWRVIPTDELPRKGVLYPVTWQFAVRPPTAIEVANFSTVMEEDRVAIKAAMEDMVKKCVKIYDSGSDTIVSTSEINDCDTLFFVLKIRDLYINQPIKFADVCQICHSQYEVSMTSNNLVYEDISEELLQQFDGRIFSLQIEVEGEGSTDVRFRIPTIGTSSRIFKQIVRAYREDKNDPDPKNRVLYDKTFTLIAPWLFVTGNEKLNDIVGKYRTVSKDPLLLEAYVTIANELKLDNLETIECTCATCSAEGTVDIMFPGGHKKLFAKKSNIKGLTGIKK